MFRTRPLTESLIDVALSYAMALGIALAFPHAGLARMMTALVPVTAVTIMTFTVFRRGQRRTLWRGLGLNRLGVGWWPVALVIPVVLATIAYAVALVLGIAELNNPSGLPGWIAANRVFFAINLAVGAIVIMGEEIGWRGFLLPRLQTALNGRPAALATIAASPVALAYVAGEGGLATCAAVWLVAGVLLGMKSQWSSRRPTADPIVMDIAPVVSSVAGPPRR